MPLTNKELATQQNKLLHTYEYTCTKPTKIFYDPEFMVNAFSQIESKLLGRNEWYSSDYSNLNRLVQKKLSLFIETDSPLKVRMVNSDELYDY